MLNTCLKIAENNPGTLSGLAALMFVADSWPESKEATAAHIELLGFASTADFRNWSRAFNEARVSSHQVERWRPLVAQLIIRVKEQPDDQDAARLVCQAGNLVAPDSDAASAPEEFRMIAELIRDRYAASPDLANFCEQVGGGVSGNAPLWGLPFEEHVRQILEVNEDRFVRCSAKLALASMARADETDRQLEARRLSKEFLNEFDGQTEYHAQSIEQMYREIAARAL